MTEDTLMTDADVTKSDIYLTEAEGAGENRKENRCEVLFKEVDSRQEVDEWI